MEVKMMGKVQAISQKGKRYGIKIGEEWFNGFGNCPWEKGQEAIFKYKTENGFKNITELLNVDPSSEVDVMKLAARRIRVDNIPKSMLVSYAKDLIVGGKEPAEAVEIVKRLINSF